MPNHRELIADDEARRVYGMTVNTMREAMDDNGRLLAVRDFSRKLDASQADAFDLVSEMAINVHSLDPDLVQGALSEGQRLRARDLKDAAGKPTEIGPDEPRPPAFSDEALALSFAERHADNVRFVAAWGKWLTYDGRCWRIDETLLAYHWVRRICREAAKRAKHKKLASSIASAKTVAAIERLARCDRRLAATVEQWDCDPWALNTPGGVIDMRTGERRPSRPDDYMTKVTSIAPDPDCPIENWERFLRTVTGNDTELVEFLQRMAGYAATGLTVEHALFFLYGTGGNGKGTFLNCVTGCLGDYCRIAPIDTFTESRNERHPTEIAALAGARLVVSQETEEGRRWAEAKVKALTGGDKISARFMRQDFFSFTPIFKLVIAGNHKPGLRSVGEAIRRRFHLVPFAVTVPEDQRDLKLAEKLRDEWPGILAWIIRGCLTWQKVGLAPPNAVKNATEEYLESEDTIAAWIEEETECDQSVIVSSGDLYYSYKSWAERSGELAIGKKTFSQRLEEKGQLFGMRKCKSGSVRGFSGRRLIPKPSFSI